MTKVWFSNGAGDPLRGLRTVFYCLFLLLPFYSASESPAKSPGQPHETGMGAPPPPLLEAHARFTSFGNPERRLLGTLPVTGYLAAARPFWNTVLPRFVTPQVSRDDLAMFQQWQLEGG